MATLFIMQGYNDMTICEIGTGNLHTALRFNENLNFLIS